MNSRWQQQADIYWQQGRFREAIAVYSQCIEDCPSLLSNYWYLGLAWLLAGEPLEAQAVWLSAMVEETPPEVDARTVQLLNVLETEAMRFFYAGKAHLAEKIYWQVLQVEESRADIHYSLGVAIAYQGKLDEAIACWQEAIAIQPDFAEAYHCQGEVFEKLELFEKAIACYLKLVELNPHLSDIHYHLGLCFCQVENWHEAISSFRTCLNLKPEFSPAYGDLGMALLREGQVDEAIACFQSGLQILPSYVPLYYQICLALTQHNREAEVAVYFQKAREVNPVLAARIDDYILHQEDRGRPHKISSNDRSVEPPTGFYETTRDWALNSHLVDSNYFPLGEQSAINLHPPLRLDRSLHFSFRFGDSVTLPSPFVAIIPGGRYWLDAYQSSSAIVTSDNKILGDVSPEFPLFSPGHPDNHPSKHSILSADQLPEFKNIDGRIAVLSGLLNDVYFHWMFDVLPRIKLLHSLPGAMQAFDGFLVRDYLSFQKETLKSLEIPETQRLDPSEFSHVRATELVVPSFPGAIAWMPKWVCDFLRRTFLPQQRPSEKIERIYISRSTANTRRILNEEDVMNLLTEFGFARVILDDLSVTEQASLLANASVVIAPHGSGLTNIVFCNPRTKVIEIFSPNYVYPCYWLVSNLVGCEYYYLLGEIPEGVYLHKLLYPHPRIEDIFVNLDELLKIVKLASIA